MSRNAPAAAHMARRTDRTHRVWLSALCLIFGAVFVLLAAQEGCYQGAVRLPATVIGKDFQRTTSSVGRGGVSAGSGYYVQYRFTTPEGETKEHWGRVLRHHYRKISPGQTIEIQYLPASRDSRVPGQTASAMTFLAIGAALVCAGLYLRRRPA